ncbi:MAG: hypothetical protein GXP25_24030 [Planctomycetes bacterium]|nr:hypothetical protein [Planctomycetota bacterium]
MGCGRKLIPVVVRGIFPDLKYVAKEGNTAVLKQGDKDLRAAVGAEILPDTGITIEKFTDAGVILKKTEVIKFEDHRKGKEGEKTREFTIHKEIPKFRESGPIHIEVMRGTKTIVCDGKWKNRVYHKEQIIIPLHYADPGTYTVPCTNPNCWNIFEVVVKDLPEVRVPITKLTDTVLCPQCGAERYLVPRGRPVVFQCVGCDRQIALYLWTPKDITFLRKEGDTAVIKHNGKQLNVKVGEELAPGSGIKLEGFGQADGKDFIKIRTVVEVKFQVFRDGKGTDKSKGVPLQDRVFVGGE